MKKIFCAALGTLSGIITGLLGAGGGLLMVPILRKCGLDQRRAHATSICVVLPSSVISAMLYMRSGRVTLPVAFPYMVFGGLGAIFGAFFLKKINQKLLRQIFAIPMLWAAMWLLFK